MRLIAKWLFRGVLAVLFFAAAASALVFLVLQRSVSPDSGEFQLAGLSKSVEVVFDKEAIPHIIAETHVDAARALGFVHARDRLWQMEVLRMAGQGRLSEMFGSATVDTDVFLRTLDMAGASRGSYEKLMPETKAVVEAYIDGINAFLGRETRLLETSLGAEFQILGHTPEAWEPWQSVLVIKVMGLTLSSNMNHEISRFALARNGFTSKEIDDLIPYGPRDNPPPLPDLLAVYGLESIKGEAVSFDGSDNESETASALELEMDWPTGQSASNNWVISGSRTESGKPILANDPHLGLTAPSTFHLAHLSWNENGERRDVIGGAVPGTPFIVVGRTNQVAWGLTTTNLDAQDLFLEKLDLNQKQYLTEGGWKPLEEKSIEIRAGNEVAETFTLYTTRNGPVLPRRYRNIKDFLPENFGLALSWPGLAHDDTTLDSLYANNYATSVPQVLNEGRRIVSPMQSVVIGDTEGNIGLAAHARTPIRHEDNQIMGRAPVPGWLPQYRWQGFLPFNDLLTIVNPSEGAITTANANYLPSIFDKHITYDWAEHFRQARAEQLVLRRREKHTIGSSVEIIGDTYSPAMVRLRDLARRIMRVGVGSHSDVRSRLSNWDGRMDADKPEPLIMLAWFRHLNIAMIKDDTGKLFDKFERGRLTRLLGMLEKAGARDWCDNQNTSEREDCSSILSSSLDAAMAELSAEFGNDWKSWKYGDAHVAYGEHRPFGQVDALARFFNVEVPSSGGPYTLLRAQTKFQHEKPYRSRHGAAFRAIYDFSDLDKSMFIQSTGQSGNIMSPYYSNFAERWSKVAFLPMTTKTEEYSRESIGTWVFNPK